MRNDVLECIVTAWLDSDPTSFENRFRYIMKSKLDIYDLTYYYDNNRYVIKIDLDDSGKRKRGFSFRESDIINYLEQIKD